MQAPVMNSIDFILAKKPDRDRFVNKLIKGYEGRRAATRLVNIAMEQLQGGGKISFEWKNNTSEWRAGTVVLDLNVARDDDPSFFGWIAHVFKLCFDEEYAQAFEVAVNSIGDARAAFFLYQPQLVIYQNEKTDNSLLMAQKANSASELADEISVANDEITKAKEREKPALDAYNLSAMVVARYGVWSTLEVVNEEIKTKPGALQEFADLAFKPKFAEAKKHEVATPEQRVALIGLYKQLYDAEAKVLERADAELTKIRKAEQTARDKLATLESRQSQVLQDQKALQDRDAFLDQEIPRLQALIS